ncbi:biogenesis of lysosome-related organelles complex 1 subunit 6 [Prorops nasuta]|uniref:biogenesis of lysosome-related organelles complex 1 subunit 6 n=1 Tax=Prorops nasuta TaxID=863751 RepID=UPI0034CDB9B6
MMKDIDEAAVAEIQSQLNTLDSQDSKEIDFTDASKKLATGLLSIYQPPLEEIKSELNELTEKQETLISIMKVENKKLLDRTEDINLTEMFDTLKVYQGKLVSCKKEMTSIHERIAKLKKRALKLQSIKQKETQQREQEIRREQELIGKPSNI